MQQSDFWSSLQCRINSVESARGSDHAALGYCDGFHARRWVFGEIASIEGRVGFVNGAAASRWHFVLHLAPGTGSEFDIDWEALMSSIDGADCFDFDALHGSLIIRPGASRVGSD